MGFRRSKQTANEAKMWRDFLQTNEKLLQSTGVPISTYGSRKLFDYFLMHGCVHHQLDPTRFDIKVLSREQLGRLVEAVVQYFRAGFPDPGIAGPLVVFRDEIDRRAGRGK
jgi:hypothetical protein